MRLVANIISLVPATLFCYVAIQSLFHKVYPIVFGFAILLNTSVELIKKYSKPYVLRYQWLSRPKDAYNCNSLNMGGCVGDKPGFPSGHVSMTTFLLTCILCLSTCITMQERIALLPVYTMIILAVAWSRIEKQCHIAVQTVAGCIFGLFVATIALLYIKTK